MLYAWAPGFPWYNCPWYDWLMVRATYAALAASIYVLESIQIGLVEAVNFRVAYSLHLMQLNFTRPAILLGAPAVALLLVATGPGASGCG